MESSTLPAKDVIAISKSCIFAVSFSEAEHKEEDVKIGGKSVKRCSIFHSITCEDHRNIAKQSGGEFKNVTGTPTFVITDADGKEISRKVGPPGSTELIDMIKAAQKKVGPGLSLADWEKTKADVAKANADLEGGKPADAVKTFEKLSKAKLAGLKAMGEEGLKAAQAKGDKLVDDAVAAAADKPDEAKKALQKIASDFSGLDCSKRAKEELKKLAPEKP